MTSYSKHNFSGRSRWFGQGLSRRARALVVALCALTGIAVAIAWALDRSNVAPRLLGMYLERRASGHADWISSAGGSLNAVLMRLDRGASPPRSALPRWAGARYREVTVASESMSVVTTTEELARKIAAAEPGDVIVLAPGRYRFTGTNLEVTRPGREKAPIFVRAAVFGTSILEFDMLEGFLIQAPYWHFSDLVIEGVCRSHDRCEHAFHIVGGAHHVVLRNNVVRDFNAHIKINGNSGSFPDSGVISNNTLYNRTVRQTAAPVTPIDLVAANNWRIEGNLIADFAKAGGDETSYAAFVKGGGARNVFLRNVVICEWDLPRAPGRRVGLSFGGGGSEAWACRDRRCITEHQDGLMAGNLIASCSDDGIYVNRAAGSKIVQNTVLDTAGIEIRSPESSAALSGNLVDGLIGVRNDASLLDDGTNQTTPAWSLYLGWHPVRDLFKDSASLDLRFVTTPNDSGSAEPRQDLCLTSPVQRSRVGAFDRFDSCLSRETVSP